LDFRRKVLGGPVPGLLHTPIITGITAVTMDLGAVAGIAALITLERVATRPEHAARAAGIVLLAAAALRIPPLAALH
jgi:hypothetical protein